MRFIGTPSGNAQSKLFISGMLAAFFAAQGLGWAAERGQTAKYIGGTVSMIRERTTGRVDVSDESLLRFVWKQGAWELPYERITKLQHSQPRSGGLFPRQNRLLTITFTDTNGKNQVCVFEFFSFTSVHAVVKGLEVRTGKKIEEEPQLPEKKP